MASREHRRDAGGGWSVVQSLRSCWKLSERRIWPDQPSWSCWGRDQRLPVDCAYCLLFLAGSFVVLDSQAPHHTFLSCLQHVPQGPVDEPIRLVLLFLRLVWLCLHIVPVLAFVCTLVERSRRTATEFYVNQGYRDWVFVFIRIIPLVTAAVSSAAGSCTGSGDAAEDKPHDTCAPSPFSWGCTFSLWVGAYQVGVVPQVWLQVGSLGFLLLWYRPSTPKCVFSLIFSVLAVPLGFAWALDGLVRAEYAKPRKGEPSPGASSPESSGHAGTSTPVRSQRPGSPVLRRGGGLSEGRRLHVEISRILSEWSPRPATRGNLFGYRSRMTVRTTYSKVQVDDPAAEENLPALAADYAQNLSVRNQSHRDNPYIVVKAVAMRGCLLFVTEEMVPEREESSSEDPSCGKSSRAHSKILHECLPEHLRNYQMEIITGDMKAKFENGEMISFNVHNTMSFDLRVPNVELLKPPCVMEHTDPEGSVDVFVSEARGQWESLKLVVVVKDSVTAEMSLPEHANRRLKLGISKMQGDCSGYLRTVGTGELLGTFVSGLAPYLMLPELAANEVNKIFEGTVGEIARKKKATEAAGTEDCHVAMEKKAWAQYFRPFALDMLYLLAPDKEELYELMDPRSPIEQDRRDDFLRVFLHVAMFLESAEAKETETFLLSRFEEANVVLHNANEDLKPMCVQRCVPTHPEYVPPKSASALASACETIVPPKTPRSEVSIWGFDNPLTEGHYRYHFNRHQVLMDLAGMAMGLCLLPVISVLGEKGKCLYLCPLVMHLRLSLFCWVVSRPTYISNREQIVMLSWFVRTVAWLGQSLSQKTLSGPLMSWTTVSFLVWTIIVKPQVLKVPFSMHMILGSLDTLIGIIGLVLSAWCKSWWSIIQGPIVLLVGLAGSIPVVYYTEKYDRERFRVPPGKGDMNSLG